MWFLFDRQLVIPNIAKLLFSSDEHIMVVTLCAIYSIHESHKVRGEFITYA